MKIGIFYDLPRIFFFVVEETQSSSSKWYIAPRALFFTCLIFLFCAGKKENIVIMSNHSNLQLVAVKFMKQLRLYLDFTVFYRVCHYQNQKMG